MWIMIICFQKYEHHYSIKEVIKFIEIERKNKHCIPEKIVSCNQNAMIQRDLLVVMDILMP